MMVHFADDASEVVKLLTMSPTFLKTFIARKATVIDKRIQQCLDHLRPALIDRIAMMDKFGDRWEDKPVSYDPCQCAGTEFLTAPQNDMLQWIIDEFKARNQELEDIACMALFINFGAIETTSNVSSRYN